MRSDGPAASGARAWARPRAESPRPPRPSTAGAARPLAMARTEIRRVRRPGGVVRRGDEGAEAREAAEAGEPSTTGPGPLADPSDDRHDVGHEAEDRQMAYGVHLRLARTTHAGCWQSDVAAEERPVAVTVVDVQEQHQAHRTGNVPARRRRRRAPTRRTAAPRRGTCLGALRVTTVVPRHTASTSSETAMRARADEEEVDGVDVTSTRPAVDGVGWQ